MQLISNAQGNIMILTKEILNYIFISSFVACFFISQIVQAQAEIPNKIVFKSSTNIKDRKEGLKEPSGLTLSNGKDALWTVSDNSTKIFLINLSGVLKKNKTISDPELAELEGVAISNDGEHLYVVREDTNEVIQVHIEEKVITKHIALVNITGYSDMVKQLPGHFDPKLGDNKGLEGITIHPNTGNIYVLKESGLLIEISADLSTILMYYNLDFADDYSGICFENANSNRIWISSDTSESIYLFDLNNKKTLKTFKLEDSKGKTYPSAEGITYDLDRKNLYLVTDDGHRLYRYEVK